MVIARPRIGLAAVAAAMLLSLSLVLVALLGAHGQVVAVGAGDAGAGAVQPAASAAAQGVRELAPSVRLLSRAVTPADAIPRAVADSPLLAGDVADVALARRVGGARPAWVVPASDGRSMCVLTTRSIACAPNAMVEHEGLALGVTLSQAGTRVTGLAADGVRWARIVHADGTSVRVPVVGNVLDVSGPERVAAVEWRGPDGPRSYRLPAAR